MKDPDGFLCLWTHALLVRLAQFAQTIPDDIRGREFPDLVQVLKPHENDLLDAYIAGCGAQCGILLTEDKGLTAKVQEVIASMKGDFRKLEDWGMRKLAYPIGGHKKGDFSVALKN